MTELCNVVDVYLQQIPRNQDIDSDDLISAIADVLCWFNGFSANRDDYDILPLDLLTLREFNIVLKKSVSKRTKRRKKEEANGLQES